MSTTSGTELVNKTSYSWVRMFLRKNANYSWTCVSENIANSPKQAQNIKATLLQLLEECRTPPGQRWHRQTPNYRSETSKPNLLGLCWAIRQSNHDNTGRVLKLEEELSGFIVTEPASWLGIIFLRAQPQDLTA